MARLAGRNSVRVSATKTRPNNTSAYAVGDIYDSATGSGLTFANAARGNGLGGRIHSAIFLDTQNPVTKGDFEVWLFRNPLGVFDNDSELWTPTDADLQSLCGVLIFATATAFVGDATSGLGGNVIYQATRTYLPLDFQCAATSRNLTGIIVVRNAYQPLANQVVEVHLQIEQF